MKIHCDKEGINAIIGRDSLRIKVTYVFIEHTFKFCGFLLFVAIHTYILILSFYCISHQDAFFFCLNSHQDVYKSLFQFFFVKIKLNCCGDDVISIFIYVLKIIKSIYYEYYPSIAFIYLNMCSASIILFSFCRFQINFHG